MDISVKEFDEDFKETIKVIFNENEVSEWYKEFEKKFNKIKDEDDEIIGKYGCSIGTMELMLFIRKRMRDEGLAPLVSLDGVSLRGKKHDENIIKYMENNSPYFMKIFKDAYEDNVKRNKLKYSIDDWNYNEIKYSNVDWMKMKICKKGNYITHYYYNELDHYLTYYVYLIKVGKNIAWHDEGLDCIRNKVKILINKN